jgi:hypothetical protein
VWILNKLLLFIAIIFSAIQLKAQGSNMDPKKSVWKQEKDYLKYKKQKDYKGPDDWYNSGPTSIHEEQGPTAAGTSTSSGSQGIQYNPQQIQQDRERQFGKGGGGSLKSDPKIKKPEPITLPEVDRPDIDAPDVNIPDVNPPMISPSFWKMLLILLLIAALIVGLFWYLKNRQPSDISLEQQLENDWNPTVISKTELELKLEDAIQREDFRECVRIYFTFILKELIRKNWIHWKKDKTNHHYIMEVASRPNSDVFRECVRIYDLVWYGEYEIDKSVFALLQPTLLNYYQSLKE